MARLFNHAYVRLVNRRPDQIPGVRQRLVKAKRPADALAVANDFEHGVYGRPRGDLAGVVPTHTIGDNAQMEGFIDREAILIGGPRALFSSSPCLQHDA